MIEVTVLSFAILVTITFVNVRLNPPRRGIEINHLLTFSFGFVYYWVLPLIVGSVRGLSDDPSLRLWYQVFDTVPIDTLLAFQFYSLLAFLAYAYGSSIAAKTLHRVAPQTQVAFDKRTLALPASMWAVIAVVYVVQLRGHLFGGYATLTPTDPAFTLVGSLTAASLGMLATVLVYTLKLSQDKPSIPFARLVRNRYYAAYWLIAVLVGSLGGRLYFVSSVAMVLIYRSVYFARFKFRSLVIVGVIGIAAAGLAGIVRIGGSVSGDAILANIFAEPLFTSISLLSGLNQHIDTLIRFPAMATSGLLNVVPSALFPSKADYLLTPHNYGYDIKSPFGATHNYVSLMLNFGSIGTLLFLFALGYLLSALKQIDRNLVYRAAYIMLSGWMAFTFFRDGFEISLDKSMLQMSVITPIVTVVYAQWATDAFRRRAMPHVLPETDWQPIPSVEIAAPRRKTTV